MHPIKALLVLKGFQACQYPLKNFVWRIKRNHHRGEPTLHWNPEEMTDGERWKIGGSAEPEDYTLVDWSELPDELIDRLDPVTMKSFLEQDSQTIY